MRDYFLGVLGGLDQRSAVADAAAPAFDAIKVNRIVIGHRLLSCQPGG